MKQAFFKALAFVKKNKWAFLFGTPALFIIWFMVGGEADSVSHFEAALLAALGPIFWCVSWGILYAFDTRKKK